MALKSDAKGARTAGPLAVGDADWDPAVTHDLHCTGPTGLTRAGRPE